MDCWNGTCFITNLPISEREEVDNIFVYKYINK